MSSITFPALVCILMLGCSSITPVEMRSARLATVDPELVPTRNTSPSRRAETAFSSISVTVPANSPRHPPRGERGRPPRTQKPPCQTGGRVRRRGPKPAVRTGHPPPGGPPRCAPPPPPGRPPHPFLPPPRLPPSPAARSPPPRRSS